MQQFGPQFINDHIMPLVEEMLTDTAQRKKDYLDKLFITGQLEAGEKMNLMDYYFSPDRANAGVPFTGQDDRQERENFLNDFIEYVRSRGAKPEDRIRAFLPVTNESSPGQVSWPMDVKRNLFLMSYNIAEDFEKEKIKELIKAKQTEAQGSSDTGKTDEAKKDAELLEKGMLTLVKDPATGEFTKYIRADELKSGDTAVEFLPAPSDETAQMMQGGFSIPSPRNLQNIARGGTSPQTVAKPAQYGHQPANQVPDQVSSTQDLTKNFQQKRGKAIINHLKKDGFEPLGDVQFDTNGHAMIKVKSGKDTLLVAVDTRTPLSENLKLNFTFQDGPHAGKSFTIEETKLDEGFKDGDKIVRDARQLYEDIDLSRKLGIKSDAYAEKAPTKQPLPNAPIPQQKPREQGFELGNLPGEHPLGEHPQAGLYVPQQNQPLTLPKDRKAGQQPHVQQQPQEEKNGIGTKIKTRPVPGIPHGSVMDAKAKLKRQKDEQNQQGQEFAQNGQNVPVALGRFGTRQQVAQAAPVQRQKSIVGKTLALSYGGGAAFGGGLGWLMSAGQQSQPTATTAFSAVHSAWIVFAHYLPRLFG